MTLVGERLTQPKTSDRGVGFLKFTLELLKSHPEGMRPQDIFREIPQGDRDQPKLYPQAAILTGTEPVYAGLTAPTSLARWGAAP